MYNFKDRARSRVLEGKRNVHGESIFIQDEYEYRLLDPGKHH